METFDYVIFKCPECGHKVEVKSKESRDIFSPYNEESVPKVIAGSILGNTVYCPNCGDRFTVALDSTITTVPLFLRKG